MNPREINAWVARTINALENSRFEDSHVELKLKWPPDPKKAARQVAAQANASSPDPFMWIIGVDEKTKTYEDAGSVELHNWYPQLKAQFETGFAPRLLMSTAYPHNGLNLYVLVFESEQAPYLALSERNESTFYWRRGTASEIACRSEIIGLFSNSPKSPVCEVQSAVLDAGNEPSQRGDVDIWALSIGIYVQLADPTPLHIPKKSIRAWIDIPYGVQEFIVFDEFGTFREEANCVISSASQITIQQTGAFTLQAAAKKPFHSNPPMDATVHVELPVIELQNRPLAVQANLRFTQQTRTGTREFLSKRFNGKMSYDRA